MPDAHTNNIICKDIDIIDEALDILSLSVLKEFEHKSSLAREIPLIRPKKHELRCPRSAAAVNKKSMKYDKRYANVQSLKHSPERSMRSNRKNNANNNSFKNEFPTERVNYKSMSDKINMDNIIMESNISQNKI